MARSTFAHVASRLALFKRAERPRATSVKAARAAGQHVSVADALWRMAGRAVMIAAAVCLFLPAATRADTKMLGSVNLPAGGFTSICGDTGPKCTVVQEQVAPASADAYVVRAPADGTIVSWSYRSANAATGNQYSLRVLRPTSAAETSFRAIATSTAPPLPDGDDLVRGPFLVNIPVKVGDRIGLESQGPSDFGVPVFHTAQNDPSTGDGVGFFSPDIGDGSTATATPTGNDGSEVLVQATIETAASPPSPPPPPPPPSPPPTTTRLQYKGCIGNNPGCRRSNPSNALAFVNDLVVTPDGNNLYSAGSHAISHFRIDSAGNLTFDGCIGNISGCRATRPALGFVAGLVVSPDGRDLYAASDSGVTTPRGPALSHLTIDHAGNLTFAGCLGVVSGCTQLPFDALPESQGIAISPSSHLFSPGGSHLYVISGAHNGTRDGDLATFTVDSAGTVRFVGCVGTVHGCTPTNPALALEQGSLTLTPNGTHLYVGAGYNGSVSEFAIDAQGNPEFRGCIGGSVDGCSSSPTSGGWRLTVAPNGKQLYASEPGGHGDVAFYRIDSGGALTFDGCIGVTATCSNPTSFPDALYDPHGLAISPDGDHLYVGGSSDLSDLPIDPAGNVGFAGCFGNDTGHSPGFHSGCTPPPGAPDALDDLVYAVAVRPGGRDIYAGTADSGAVSHFRIGGSFTVTKALIVGLVETHKVFVVGKPWTPIKGVTAATQQHPPTGTVFSFTLNQPATVKIAIQGEKSGRRAHGKCQKPTAKLRHSRACTRHVTIFTLTRTAHAGLNKVPFTGRIRGTALTPGHYQAVFTPSNKAGRSRTQTIRFTIVKP